MHLAVIQTHPVQYYAPVYRHLQQSLGVRTTVIYGSEAGVSGYRDPEFARELAWDVDLTEGYGSVFLGGGAPEQASTRGLRRALAAASPDAVLLTGYSPRFNALAALIAVQGGVPLMLRADASDVSHQRGWWHSMARDRVLRALYARIQRFLFVGRNAHAHYLRLGVRREDLVFSPLSVPGTHFLPREQARDCRSQVRQELELGEDVVIVLFSGKFNRKKSPDHVLQAAQLLSPRLRDRVALVFMGDGSLSTQLRRSGCQADAPSTRVIGFKNQSQLSRYYHACDLLVLPSLYRETWGLVVNEAMMHGKPCVVSDRVGCHGDLIETGVTGYVHRHGDVRDLAAALTLGIELAQAPETAGRCMTKVARYSTAAAATGVRDAMVSLG